MAPSATFDLFLAQHRAAVVRYLRRRLGDGAAEDAAMAVFRMVARSRSGGHLPPPTSWPYALTGPAIGAHWRAERTRLERLEQLTRWPPPLHPALAPSRYLDPRIAHGLRTLPAVDRETLLLCAWSDLDRDTVAAALSVPSRVVHQRLVRVAEQIGRTTPLTSESKLAPHDELIAALAENADLGLDPIRQPRIEYAVDRRFAGPRRLQLAHVGRAQRLGA
jgi:DNA-directed RNA polymerase specialized sigma24 family protein